MQEVQSPPRLPSNVSIKVTAVETPAETPATLLGWLPIVWTRVLFAGPMADVPPLCWRSFLILFVLSGALLYPCMSFHLFEPDEGRYAQIPREMLERGDWIVPTLQQQPYLDKPPLFYWLVALSFSIFGFHDWAARLVPALAMHGAVMMTYLLGRRIVGERSAFWGALLLIVSPIFLGVGRLLVLDGLLTFWVTASLLTICLAQDGEEAHIGWWFASAVSCGLGVLTKGPIAMVLVLVPLLMHRMLAPSARVTWLAWLGFFAVIAAINLPWYGAVCWQRPEFVRYFLWQHNIERFVEPFDHVRPVWFYVPIVLFGLLPTLFFGWPLWRYLTSLDADAADARCPAVGYLLLAGAWCVFFFSLAGSKLPTYILPAFPPLCLALGCFAARTGWCESRWFIGSVALCWLALAFSHYYAIPVYAGQKSPVSDMQMIEKMCGDPKVPIVCFPRNVDSVAFYVGRSDFRTFRSKEIDNLVVTLHQAPRTVILFGHRNSPETLARHLPAHLRMVERRPLGLCEMAVIERVE